MDRYLDQFLALAMGYAPKVVGAIATLIIGFWVANKVSHLVSSALRKRNVEETIIPFLSSIVNTVLKVMVLISVAGMFGIETTSFVTLIGAAGLAVGLALQGSLSHFASGVLLLVFRPYKVGDRVTIAGFTGEVDSIQIFNTVLKTLDNKRIFIPNASVTSGPITNISGQGPIRVDMMFLIDAGEDVDKVRSVIQETANHCPEIVKSPAIEVYVYGHDLETTKFYVHPWCHADEYWNVFYYMQEHVKKQLQKEGIKAAKVTEWLMP